MNNNSNIALSTKKSPLVVKTIIFKRIKDILILFSRAVEKREGSPPSFFISNFILLPRKKHLILRRTTQHLKKIELFKDPVLATAKKSLQREALQLVFWQLIVTMALALIILLIGGFKKSLSTFLGGSTYILPQFLFAWRVFSYARLATIGPFMIAFFLGEFVKLILSAALFILIVKYLPVNVVFTMTGYIAAIVSFWFVCGWHFGRASKAQVSS
jgi:ATP synthase protein I